ncbi:hypothetical protein LGV61_05825 [Desulfurispirillum indicum]|uniref:Uncharacterized protein n=1 Tax=Desulfurispirillum indicum (strain ATCC BAA-1389 / DSM 22839 / S5) TaxID=653733 RepID=E6W3Y3_DESIS|nr:hypothetical protein [Desulfurispirillum indicum]ADU65851.1 hypothetical protein Selin_1116 [Desulfurispirillum indicum S5]UCZ57787.1 hypothetical protein LGV61_05825 [Desulfurispirillum indicum]
MKVNRLLLLALLLLCVLSAGFIVVDYYNIVEYTSEDSFVIQSVYFTAGEVDDARKLQEQGLLQIDGYPFADTSRQTRVKPTYTWNPQENLFVLSHLQVMEAPSNIHEMWKGDPRFEIALENTFEMTTRAADSLYFASVEKERIDTPENYPIFYPNPLYHYEHGFMRIIIGSQTHDRIMGKVKDSFEKEYADRKISATFGTPNVEYIGHPDKYAMLEMWGKENLIDDHGTVHHDNYRRTALIYPKAAHSNKHKSYTYFVIDFYGQNTHPLVGNSELAAITDIVISTFTPTVKE